MQYFPYTPYSRESKKGRADYKGMLGQAIGGANGLQDKQSSRTLP